MVLLFPISDLLSLTLLISLIRFPVIYVCGRSVGVAAFLGNWGLLPCDYLLTILHSIINQCNAFVIIV